MNRKLQVAKMLDAEGIFGAISLRGTKSLLRVQKIQSIHQSILYK